MKTKILCILDGFGLGPDSINNPITTAKIPNIRRVMSQYFWTTLDADGEAVGQESGLVGNSEVGHINIGGLQLVPQLSYQITKSSHSGFVETQKDQLINPSQFLKNKFQNENKTIHLIGLFSTGTIHSDLRHWAGAIESADKSGASKIILHLFSDGRDSDKKSLLATWQYFISNFKDRLQPFEDKIFLGSLGGRFYGMDRDKNWEWTKETTDKLLIKTKKQISFWDISNKLEALTRDSYNHDIFDENISPIGFYGIYKNDTLWLINHRSDRMKQLTQTLCEINQEFELDLYILSMNDYGIDQKSQYTPIFCAQPVQNTLAQTISKHTLTQLHIAETEKYAHVTYFLNGGKQEPHQGEDWILIPSNKVNSHAEEPKMKAKEITDYIIENGIGKYDYIIVNYANPDMVAHTGLIPQSIQSIEFLDQQLGRLIDLVEQNNHSLIITADHGNCEFVGPYIKKIFSFSKESNKEIEMEQNQTDTEHNPNPVPCIIIDSRFKTENRNQYFDNIITKTLAITKTNNLEINHQQLSNALKQQNQYLVNQESWPTQDQINNLKSQQLPLWYAGVLLLLV